MLSGYRNTAANLPKNATSARQPNAALVLLEQQTERQTTENISDTGAYTDTIFGIFHLKCSLVHCYWAPGQDHSPVFGWFVILAKRSATDQMREESEVGWLKAGIHGQDRLMRTTMTRSCRSRAASVGGIRSISGFLLVTECEHKDCLLARHVAVEGDITGLPEPDHELPHLRLIVERSAMSGAVSSSWKCRSITDAARVAARRSFSTRN